MSLKHTAALWGLACIGMLLCHAPASGQVALSGQVDLARAVDLCAQRLHLRISYDDGLLKSKVTLRQDAPLTDIELWRFTSRLLADQGLTTVRAGDDETLAVVKIATATQIARIEQIETLRQEKASGQSDVFVAQPGFRRVLIPLKRVSTKDVVTSAQLVLSKPGGSITEADQAGFVVISDLTPYLETALTLIDNLDGPDGGGAVRMVEVRNTDPARLAVLAKQFAEKRRTAGSRELRGEVLPAPGGGAGSPGSTGSVMVIAPAAQMDQWESIIATCDQREPVERRTYATGAFGLHDVASLIDQTVRGNIAAGSAGGAAGSADDRWRVVQDDLTGTLIITASPAQHEQIEELLKRLASVPAESRRPVRTFKVRNRGVKEVQQVVEDLLRAGVLDAQAAGDSGSSDFAAPGPVSSATQTSPRPFTPGGSAPLSDASPTGTSPLIASNLGQSAARSGSSRGNGGSSKVGGNTALTITSDEATNTLIAVGEPRLLSQLEKLLPTLDVRQPQVMLEAMLVSLNDSQSLNLGAELEHLRVTGDTMIRLSSLFGLSTAAASSAERTRTVGDGAGFTGTVLNPGDFSVVVRALQTISQGRSVSIPKVLVNNNQQATFNSVLQQPFATTNASTTVATTAFGGTQDAGTTISVKPQIAEGDHLVLTYSVSLSSFVGTSSSANLPPPRQQNSVQSVATIPDGYTVVVGGLELNTDGKDVSQIPGIGDVPLIGELFKNRSKSIGRQRFYVFLRASVLRQPNLEDLKYLSDVQANSAGIDDGWPVVEPRLIGDGTAGTGAGNCPP